MRRQLNKITVALLATAALASIFSGCSSDGGDDDGGNPAMSSSSAGNGGGSSSSGGTGGGSSSSGAGGSSSSGSSTAAGSYLPCPEAEAVHNDCSLRYAESFPILFPACTETCGDDEDCLAGCLSPVIFECFDENGFCGDSSSADNDACEEHYRSECDFMDDD